MIFSKFFNVGHGEAILINSDSNNFAILRDFGRSKYARNTKYSLLLEDLVNYVPLISSCHNLDAILSHAHEDHYNGFEMLHKKNIKCFNNAYIPWLRMTDLNSLGGLLIKYSIFLYRYYGSSLISTNARNWLRAAPVMNSVSNKLWFVSTGHSVKDWEEENKILWPRMDTSTYVNKLTWYWYKYLDQNELPFNFLDEESNLILNELKKIYPKNNDIQSTENIGNEQINEILRNIDNVINNMDEFNNIKLTSPKNLYNKAYKWSIDNHSIIFEIGSEEFEDAHLYLSDADDKTIEQMIFHNNISNKNYRVIKSAHHGNRGANALSASTITSQVVINCCGPAHPRWHGPDIDYNKISKTIFCTDWSYSIKAKKKWKNISKYNIRKGCCISI